MTIKKITIYTFLDLKTSGHEYTHTQDSQDVPVTTIDQYTGQEYAEITLVVTTTIISIPFIHTVDSKTEA